MIESLGTWSYRFVAPYHASKTLPRNQAKPIVISIHAPRHQNLTSSIRTRKNLKTRVTVTVFPFPQLCTAIQIYGQRQFVYVYHARALARAGARATCHARVHGNQLWYRPNMHITYCPNRLSFIQCPGSQPRYCSRQYLRFFTSPSTGIMYHVSWYCTCCIPPI